MRSLLLTFDYPPTVGGIAVVLEHMWRLAGHSECLVLAPDADGAEALDMRHPVPTTRFWAPTAGGIVGKMLTFASGALSLLGGVLRHKPDLLIAGQVVRAGPIAWLFHRLTGRPYDLWVYGGETRPGFAGGSWVDRIVHRILRDARTLFTNSPYTSQEMLDFGLPTERVVEIPLGVDRTTYQPGPPSDDLIERYGLQDRLTLLTVGRLVERKGVDRMLQALAQVDEQLPPWRYLVVSDGPYRHELEALNEKLGLTDRVTFCGFVEEDRLLDYYRTCDIFAMPNREVIDPAQGSLSVEGFGIVFLEAAACGKPVIAGRSGGAVHAVDDGTNGILVEGDDPASIGDALVRLADEETRRRMGDAGIEFAARFDWDRSAALLRQYL